MTVSEERACAGSIDRIVDRSSRRTLAWAWVTFFTYLLVAFPLFEAFNGMPADVAPLDLRLVHDADPVAEVLAALGDAGRAAYLRSLLIADVGWPLVYGITLGVTIA